MPSLSTMSRAPPRKETSGRPPASLRTSTLRQLMPRRQPVPIGLEDGLFGRPAAGEVLRGHLPALAILDFVLRVDAADELLGMTLDHLRNAQTLDDVGADANNVDHGTSRILAAGLLPAGRTGC